MKRAAKKRPLYQIQGLMTNCNTFCELNVDGKSTAFKVFYDAIDTLSLRSKMLKTIIRNMERCLDQCYASRRST
jgi:hypothetical protein